MCDLGTRDLGTLTKSLLSAGMVTTPPMESVARRARHIQHRRARTVAAAALVVAVIGTASVRWAVQEVQSSRLQTIRPAGSTTTTTQPARPPVAPRDDAAAPPAPTTTAPPAPTTTTTAPRAELSCRLGENGGATDRGVTADTIRVTMTETLRFPERYTTVDAYDAVRSVFASVNWGGGICGRLLQLDLANPVWGASPWSPRSDAVAGIGGPLDENVDEAILDGRVDAARTPIVGTGLAAVQFSSPWVWPVLPPARSLTRIAVDHAYRVQGGRTFALVYEADSAYAQAAAAFADYVATLPGAAVVTMQPVRTDDTSYRNEALDFALRCANGQCDHVLLALSERTVRRWTLASLVKGRLATAGFPSLARSQYADECVPFKTRLDCEQLHVWTGPTAAAAAASVLPPECTSDARNVTFVDSARIGACRLVEALRRVGPDLTRAHLRAALDDLAAELSLVRVGTDGHRVFDIPARASTPALNDDVVPLYELRPATDWLRDPAADHSAR